MDTRTFHIGDILSVLTGRMLSPEGVSGIYKILNHLTGAEIFTHQIPRAMHQCQPWLREQLPWSTQPALSNALAFLDTQLAEPAGKRDPGAAVAAKLSYRQIIEYEHIRPEEKELTQK